MVQKSFKYIALFALLIIVGCKSDQNDQLYGKPIKQTSYSDTINFIGHWLNEGDRELFVRNMARSYEFENQDINVNLVFPEDIYYDPSVRGGDLTFITQLIKNRDTKWDIIRINGIYSGISKLLGDDEWGKKYLVDFSEIPEFCENTLPNLLSSKEKEKWNGIIPGPYMEGNYWALWVNLDVAKKIGIEVKQYGMQFEDL
ncbi:MAG: hypothetical protein JXB49_18220 [Bacteroidales bacterium]|nr:hypothetical protein [Bacteroidales bacterium]